MFNLIIQLITGMKFTQVFIIPALVLVLFINYEMIRKGQCIMFTIYIRSTFFWFYIHVVVYTIVKYPPIVKTELYTTYHSEIQYRKHYLQYHQVWA